MNKQKFIILLLSLPLLWTASLAYAQIWQEPQAAPPGGNLLGPAWLLPLNDTRFQVGSVRVTGDSSGEGGIVADYGGFFSSSNVSLRSYSLVAGNWAGYFGSGTIATAPTDGDGNLFAKRYCLPDGADADLLPDCVTSWWDIVSSTSDLWTQEASTNNIFKGTDTNLEGIVAIGTATPSTTFTAPGTKLGIFGDGARLYIDGNTTSGAPAGNPEIDLKISSSPDDHWAIYADETSRQLRFWSKEGADTPAGQGRNNIALTSDGVMVFSGWQVLTPLINALNADNVASSSARLRAQVNPNGDTTSAWFRLWDTTSPGVCKDTGGTLYTIGSIGSGTSYIDINENLSGLKYSTNYYFCAIAQNGSGKTLGDLKSFTTKPATAPIIDNGSVTANPGSTSAVLSGSVNPNGYATTAWFRYIQGTSLNCDDSQGIKVTPTTPASGGPFSVTTTVSGTASPLSSPTTYSYCLIAENAGGKVFSTVKQFTTVVTGPPSSVTTNAADINSSGTTVNNVLLSGSANPQGLATTAWFRLWDTTSPGSCNDTSGTKLIPASPAGGNLGSGATSVSFSLTQSGLKVGTTYYYCAIAQNSSGTTLSNNLKTFRYIPDPTVQTLTNGTPTSSSVVLNGKGNPQGYPTTGYFRITTSRTLSCQDITSQFVATTPSGGALGSGTVDVNFSSTRSVVGSRTYYYCAVAKNENESGYAYGDIVSFTTPLGTNN